MLSRRFLLLSLLFLNLILFSIVLDAKAYFQPQVVIVPHHDLVKVVRQKVLADVARRRPQTKTIVLLSPDHFNPNQHLITSSDQISNLPFRNLISQDLNPVKNDHGIYALLPDIKEIFPNAKIVPILLGQQLKTKDLEPLTSSLNQFCFTDCLIIASVDFSHYLPVGLANVHDAYSLKILSGLDLNSVMDLEVDSPQALYLALTHAKAQNAPRFILKKHTNSGEMIGNFDVETTSHFMGWFQRGQPLPIDNQTFVFAVGLDPNSNQKTLGDRFFYGADITNTLLSSPQSPVPNLIIKPSSVSSLDFSGHDLTVNLGPDLAVAGIVSPSGEWQLILLPLTNQNFTRGPIKQAALGRLLTKLPSPFQINPKQGVITYLDRFIR